MLCRSLVNVTISVHRSPHARQGDHYQVCIHITGKNLQSQATNTPLILEGEVEPFSPSRQFLGAAGRVGCGAWSVHVPPRSFKASSQVYTYTKKRSKRANVEYVQGSEDEEAEDVRDVVSNADFDADADEDIFRELESGSRVFVRIVGTRSVNTLRPGFSSVQDISVTRHIPLAHNSIRKKAAVLSET